MKKDYRFIAIVFLLLAMAMNVSAQKTAYVAVKSLTNSWKEGYGWNGCVFAFDIANPSAVTEVAFNLEPIDAYGMEEALFVQSGTSAGDTYYAMCKSEFDSENSFCTLNFTTGTKTVLGDGFEYLEDMAYDATGKVLYGVEYDYTNHGTFLHSIDKKSGELSLVYNIPDIKIVGIATDGNQNLYGIEIKGVGSEYVLSLYLIDPAKKEVTKLHEALGTIENASSFTLDYSDGTLYFIAGKNFITIDPKAGTMNVAENKLPTTPLALAGLCFTKSTADGTQGGDDPEPENNIKVRVVETWGDIMGDATGCTKREVTYYDADNKPLRTCMYGKQVDKNEWRISRFTTYVYNEENQLIQKFSEQYGLYDGEDFAFKAAGDTVNYEYDDKGRLAKEITLSSSGYITYEYDDADNLIKKTRYNLDRYDEYEGDYYVMESYTYSDFKAPNCPQMIQGDGAYDSYKTVCKLTYDANNNKTSAKTYDITGEILRKAEYWTYDENGMLTLYENKKVTETEEGKYDELDKEKIVYTFDNDNPNRIKKESFSYYKGEWGGVPYWDVTETAEYNGLYSTELAIEEVADEINTVKLMFSVPNIPATGGLAFDIYRHGIKIARVLPSDEGAYDPETQTLSYIDKEVKNGLYDYFVQTVTLSEMGDESEEEGFNISNVVKQNIFIELPMVTNIRYASHKVEDNSYLVTVAWDAPKEVDPVLGFKRYNVFVKGFKVAENRDEDGLPTTFEVNFGDIGLSSSKSKDIIIESVFKYGKVKAGPTTVSFDPVGIVSNEMSEMIQIDGDVITVNSDNTIIDVISLSGAVLNRYQHVNRIDLSALDKGIYLIKVACDGKMHVIKFTK